MKIHPTPPLRRRGKRFPMAQFRAGPQGTWILLRADGRNIAVRALPREVARLHLAARRLWRFYIHAWKRGHVGGPSLGQCEAYHAKRRQRYAAATA